MSKLRSECQNATADSPCPRGLTAYLSIYNSVKGESFGLIHGRLTDSYGHHCAIGSFFAAVDKGTALPTDLVDEVATVNDSCRYFTPKQRKTTVLRWLRWKLESVYGYCFSGRRSSLTKKSTTKPKQKQKRKPKP